MNLVIYGLIFDIVGVAILTIVAIWNPHYTIIGGEKEWWKKYSWWIWSPIYRNTETLEWKINWNRMEFKKGLIPPKHKGNILGFLFILLGFILQLIFYLV